MKKTVGARELKTRLGTYLRHVQNGTTIIVTERGRPVAELRPLARSSKKEQALLEELVMMGELSRTNSEPLAPFEPVDVSGALLSDAVIEDREDRF